MSRCFPFPPPGYETKVGADNRDVLKQDKHKEKKHKKDKRGKDRLEGKKKKEEPSDEKHRHKRAKKDKHRDKKDKEKDKERERDRSSTSNENNQLAMDGHFNQDKRFDYKGAQAFPALQSGEKSTDKEKGKNRNSIAENKRPSVTLGGQNGERAVFANHVGARVCNAKCIQDLAKRLKNDQCSGSEQAAAIPEQQKNDVKGQLFGKAAGAGLEGKEKAKERRPNNEKKMDENVIKEQTGLNGMVKVQSFGEALGRTELHEIAKPSKVNAKEMEWREIMTGREGDDKQGDKLKVQYTNKSKGKVKESRIKEDKSKEKSEQKHLNQEKSKAGSKNGMLGSTHLNSLQPLKEPNRTVASEGNIKKRKAETNGFMPGDEIRANKLQKQSQNFQLPIENGTETYQISTKMTPPSHPQPVHHVLSVNKEERKINGVKGTTAHTSPVSPLYHPPPSSAVQGELLLAEASSSVKSPHPDSMFLGEILKVPKFDELPDLDDDQGWLFHKPDFENFNTGPSSTFEVWGECLHIESADIYALPYVFPY